MLSNHDGSADDLADVHSVSAYETGTVALNSIFVLVSCLLITFFVKPGCQTGHAYSRTEQIIEQ